MNVYEKMLREFHKAKGTELKSFTKEKDLESLLNTLSICENIKEKYGLDLSNRNVFSGFSVSSIDRFSANVYMNGGDGYVGSITGIYNSAKQPKSSQILLKISHPTGAYIFGDYYPVDLFNEFFSEVIENTMVEYCDHVNHSLYYTLENTMDTLKKYDEIYKKYIEKNKENYRRIMIERKKHEIEALERGKIE